MHMSSSRWMDKLWFTPQWNTTPCQSLSAEGVLMVAHSYETQDSSHGRLPAFGGQPLGLTKAFLDCTLQCKRLFWPFPTQPSSSLLHVSELRCSAGSPLSFTSLPLNLFHGSPVLAPAAQRMQINKMIAWGWGGGMMGHFLGWWENVP